MALPFVIYLLYDQYYRRNHLRIIRKNLRDEQNPFELSNERFVSYFRLSKPLVVSIIENLEIHVNLGRRRNRIPFHLKVLSTLYFLGNGSYQTAIGGFNFSCMSQAMISISIGEVCRLIALHLMPTWIKFPTNAREYSNLKQGFYNKWHMIGIIGAIDGTHVQIIAPPVSDDDHPPFVYINRKGVHSINVMLICDSDNMITGVNARFPGSVHDSAIWQMSDIRAYLRNEYENGNLNSSFLIGDSGYGLEPWLLTPYANFIDGSPQARFNNILKTSRNVIERTNGILKGRFRCLSRHRVLNYHPSKAAYIIYACAVLHNMAVTARIDPPFIEELNDNYVEQADGPVQDGNLLNNARQIRDTYVLQNM